MDPLQGPLQYLKGVGPSRAADLQRAGLSTIEDLLYRFPTRYEDRGHFQTIASLKRGVAASVAGEILSCGIRPTRRPRFKIFEMLVRDRTGSLRAIWFNQPFLNDIFHPHQRIILFGKLELTSHGLQMQGPQYELTEGIEGDEGLEGTVEGTEGAADREPSTINTGRIGPIHEKTGQLTAKMQRTLVHHALQQLPTELPDPLQPDVRGRQHLIERRAALETAHFPPADASVAELNALRSPAHRRLIFEEFFLFQLGIVQRRRRADAERKKHTIVATEEIRRAIGKVLPFKLTNDQVTTIREIVKDMERSQPMNRLLQGDVGSGKTIVALMAALVAMENGVQVAFMAPTEILAEQHFLNIRRLLEESRFRLTLLTGGTPARKRREILAELAGGSMQMVIGTHALVQEDVAFRELGLAIIDEQHRFGVLQRATLRAKGLHPDVLVMTATPIPRTLALTTYGDLDVSTMREMPPGRQPIATTVRPESRRDEVYAFVRDQLDAVRQDYLIYPLVEEAAKVDVKAATEMDDHLSQQIFPAYRVGLLHGRLKADAKDRVMKAFAAGELQLLVTTTVVEVGVDVANASVMIVEHAERFGLSQLHQLRGRVGRDRYQSYCFLLYQAPLSDEARARLKAMTETADGFEISERDLRLRGPGDFFGTRQAGVPTFRMIDLVCDRELLDQAQQEAARWFTRATPSGDGLDKLLANWEQRFRLIEVG